MRLLSALYDWVFESVSVVISPSIQRLSCVFTQLLEISLETPARQDATQSVILHRLLGALGLVNPHPATQDLCKLPLPLPVCVLCILQLRFQPLCLAHANATDMSVFHFEFILAEVLYFDSL